MKYICFFAGLALFLACRKEIVKSEVQPLTFEQPAHFPAPHYTFANNTLTDYRFSLGRDLFYEKRLSSDNSVSCANCHAQNHSFADHNVAFSTGVNSSLGTRNAPALINLAWSPSFLWDGGVNHLDVFSFAPITNPLEMHETMQHVVSKLNADSLYRAKFRRAYGTEEVTDQHILQALGQFTAMLVSANSKYDQYVLGETSLTSDELAGLNLFRTNCASCHSEPLFTDHSYRNNGLDSVFTDEGRYHITQNQEDLGKFKVPTLRNVAYTYPYMHDGRFFTLDQVIDHYSEHVLSGGTTESTLLPMHFSDTEREQLKRFLYTLTDYSFLSDYRFSERP